MPRDKDSIISKPKPLKFESGDYVANWNTFKEEWEAYEEASGLEGRTSTERLVTFLRVVGKDAINIYNSFSWTNETDGRNIEKVIEKFETLCLSDKSIRFHRYLFHKREQETAEKVDDYVADIRNLAESCGFGDIKEMLISDKIIFGLKNHYVKEQLLKSEELDSKKVIELVKVKQQEYEKKQKEILKAKELLKNKRKGKMADDQEMLGYEDDMNGAEEVEYDEDFFIGEGNSCVKQHEDDELILKADSDIEEVQEDEAEAYKAKSDESEGKVTPQPKTDAEVSDEFRIELRGLPKYYAMGQLKKLLNETLQLKAHKIKPAGNNKDWTYVSFRDEKSRTKALAVLDEYEWRKCILSVCLAKPSEDPIIAKRAADANLIDGDDPDAKLPINERVVKSVTPFAHRTYEDQLQEKYKAGLEALKKFGKEMAITNPELKDWVKFHKLRRKGQVCEVDEVVPSPEVNGYCNKCEFTVGFNPEDELLTVGYRVSSYKSESLAVGPVSHLVHIPESMKTVAKVFQEYVRSSDLKPFDPLTQEGMWRHIIVRTSSHDDILIAVVVHPQDLSDEELGDLKQNIVDFFKDGTGASAGVTSIFFQAFGEKEPNPEEIEYEHLWGEEYITETVLGKTFRISCESFFQNNTKGCEALYETVASFAELDGTSVILDVCCGTGTIGVSLADQCLKVYGIEMMKKAAEDARHNADLNGLGNVAIYTGKAEVNMNTVLSQCVKYKTVGIVDPPRTGLSESVIRSLRKCENMDHLIYMTSDPDGCFKNFIDLSRPKSKNYKGEFLVPIRAAVVDMFPHTPNYELLILFERWEERKWRRIMEGHPLPRDEDYFNRIPAKPAGEYVDSDEEEEEKSSTSQKTGMGTWKATSGKPKREYHQPYTNPRQQYRQDEPVYMGGRSFERGYSRESSLMGPMPTSLMGEYPSDDRQFGRRDRQYMQDYGSYYNDPPNRLGSLMGRERMYDGRLGSDRMDSDRMLNRRGMYSSDRMFGNSSMDPYRLGRMDYDQDPYGPSGLDAYRRNSRSFNSQRY